MLSADSYVTALGSYSPRLLRPLGIDLPVWGDLDDAGRASFREQLLERVGYLSGRGITTISSPIATTRSLDEYLEYVAWFSDEVIAGAD